MLERTSDHLAARKDAPQQPQSVHQTPFYVFPRFEQTKIVTLPDAKLIQGHRSAVVSDIDNAIKIAGKKKLEVKAMPPNEETNEREGRLDIPLDNLGIGYGYVVDVAGESLPDTGTDTDAILGNPTHPDSTGPLEVHDPMALVALYEQDPKRRNDVAILRILGAFMLQQPRE